MTSVDASVVKSLVDIFIAKFKYEPVVVAFAPGRVNLIGEHTDYNDGFVLPFALPMKTSIVGSRTETGKCRVFSTAQSNSEAAEFCIDPSICTGEPVWVNYIKGVVCQYLNDLPSGFGFDCVVHTTVPIGSGLSSSASLEVAVATLIEFLCGGLPHVTGVEKARRCQKAEHDFAHVPCGIMDQYISAMGAAGNLLLIDCRSNSFELVPFGNQSPAARGPVIVVTNSNVKHALSGSEYPDRVRQCRLAVEALQKHYPRVTALRDATLEMLETIRSEVSPTVFNRAKHCVSEDLRTLATVRALRAGDYATAGRCMTESHVSLQRDYEVSCAEIDVLVDLALQVPGVLGSRITGGGFGGCTVTLVERDSVSTLQAFVSDHYERQTGAKCEFYVAVPSEGAGALNICDVPPAPKTGRRGDLRKKPAAAMSGYVLPMAIVAVAIAVVFVMARQQASRG